MEQNHENTAGGGDRDELLWTAYRYAAGELDEAAAAAFEARLADGAAACEALALAVGLGETVRAALELPTPQEAGTRAPERPMPASRQPMVAASAERGSWAWWAVATAACVALAFAWQTFHRPAVRPVGETAEAQAEADSQLLAALGPEHRWDAPSALLDELLVEETPAANAVDADDATDDAFSMDDMSVAAPDWLLAAVVESSSDAGNE